MEGNRRMGMVNSDSVPFLFLVLICPSFSSLLTILFCRLSLIRQVRQLILLVK